MNGPHQPLGPSKKAKYRMSIKHRIAASLGAATLVVAPALLLAPSAAAMECGDGTDDCNIVIEGEDGYLGITTLSGDIALPVPDFVSTFEISYDADGNLICLNEDGTEMDMSVMTENCELDRSGLARTEGDEIETGDGYENIVPIDGELAIVPIDATTSGSNTGWIVGGIAAGVVLVGAGAIYGVRRHSAAKA